MVNHPQLNEISLYVYSKFWSINGAKLFWMLECYKSIVEMFVTKIRRTVWVCAAAPYHSHWGLPPQCLQCWRSFGRLVLSFIEADSYEWILMLHYCRGSTGVAHFSTALASDLKQSCTLFSTFLNCFACVCIFYIKYVFLRTDVEEHFSEFHEMLRISSEYVY